MIDQDHSDPPGSDSTKSRDGAEANKDLRSAIGSQVDTLMAAVKRLEAFAAVEAKRVSAKLEPVEAKARENLWTTIFLALGLGVILGLLMGRSRQRD